MAHAWVDVTYVEPAELDKLIADRKTKAAPKLPGVAFVAPALR